MVSEEMVASMTPGSIIIDVSIDQAAYASEMTSHSAQKPCKYDVVHCVPNIAPRAPAPPPTP
jgi:alanine dehydrogenase